MFVSTSMAARTAQPARKRGYHHGDLARALVVAALDIIAKKGPEAFTIREAAAAVGVTHGAAYRHFEDKDALLAAVAEEGYRQLTQRLSKVALEPTTDARARLRAHAAAYVEFALEHPAHYRVMWGPRLNEDGRFPSLEAAISEAFARISAEIERGQSEGVFREGRARDLAIGVWVTAHGYVELVARRRLKVKSQRVAVDYFLSLFEPVVDGLTRRPR
ncbi:MAG: TetR/AcrR family transcriptional regulator [Deltaproteobacteria bacterium]|nr:TetR/AcrR family transcriptional regulator [Deltaproteobacteria bacterium]